MGPKPKKLTKKQEQELEEKRKEEAKIERLKEIERKRLEEERNKKIEEKNRKIQDDIEVYKQEQQRLSKEEKELKPQIEQRESQIQRFFQLGNQDKDWKLYSECDVGYINVRREKEVTAFIYEFEERMDAPFYINNNFIEKEVSEELIYFDHLMKHYKSITKLYYEAYSTMNRKTQDYCVEYLNKLKILNKRKIEYLTRYFLENFEKLSDMHRNPSKYNKGQNSVEKTTNNFSDMCIEWVSTNSKIQRIGFWCNNSATSREAVIANFKHIPCKIQYLPNQCVSNTSIIRFVYSELDDKDIIIPGYFPYLSINGLFKLDFIAYPSKAIKHKSWEIKELINDNYFLTLNKDTFGQQIRMSVTINIDKKIYLKDMDMSEGKSFIFGRYNEALGQWSFDPDAYVNIDRDQRTAVFKDYSDINTFTLLIDKKSLFPYKSWYLRTKQIQKECYDYEANRSELKTCYIARLDLDSKPLYYKI